MSYLASFLFGDAESISEEDINELEKFENSVKYMDSKRLLEVGRKLIQEGDYPKAEILYNQLNKYNEFKPLSEIYLNLIKTRRKSSEMSVLTPFFEAVSLSSTLGLEHIVENDKSAESIKECMQTSMQLYREGKMDRKDISAIELIVDKISKEIKVSNTEEFNKSYTTFKEYIIQNT